MSTWTCLGRSGGVQGLGMGGGQGRGGSSELLVRNDEAGFLSPGAEFLAKGGFSVLSDHGDCGCSFGELIQGPYCHVLGRWGRVRVDLVRIDSRHFFCVTVFHLAVAFCTHLA